MRMPRSRFRLVNLLAAVAILAVSMAVIKGLTEIYIPSPIQSDTIMLRIKAPIGPGGREVGLTAQQWEVFQQQMSTPVVLNAALADPKLSSLARIRNSANPRAELVQMFHLSLISNDPRIDLIVWLGADAPTIDEAMIVTGAMSRAIDAAGLVGVSVIGRPSGLANGGDYYKWGPLNRPWKVVVAWMLGIFTALAALFTPIETVSGWIRSVPGCMARAIRRRSSGG